MNSNLNVFLLIGQSNMAGRGRLDDVPSLQHAEVSMLRNSRWIPAAEPLHTDKPGIAGIGLGMSFAVELATRATIAPIGLIPCAFGGTSLGEWMPGTELYENAVSLTRAALRSGGQLRGILWHQGEGDSENGDDASSYGRRFQAMIGKLRAELSAETVPVITGELGTFLQRDDGTDFSAVVNQELRGLEDAVPVYGCVGAHDLGHNGDELHFDAASLREFGIRYATKYIEMTSQPSHSHQ
jgi:hypothetical protein